MQITLDPSEWRKRRLYVATPMYGNSCTGTYVNSLLALQNMCVHMGIQLMHSFIFNESLITRARNQLAYTFLQSNSTHLMFIDADIGFSAEDVITMLGLMDERSEYDVMAGVYRTKTILWDRVEQAVRDNKPALSRSGANFVVVLPSGQQISFDRPTQALRAGTGFMMIKRNTLDVLQSQSSDNYYLHNEAKVQMFFQADIDQQSKIYLSEDFWFCQRVIDTGRKIWICPWMTLDHVGNYTFSGALSDLVG